MIYMKKVNYVIMLSIFIIVAFFANMAMVFAEEASLPDFYVENFLVIADKVFCTIGNKGSAGIGDKELEMAYQFLDKSGTPLTDPYTWTLKGFPYPIGKKINVFFPFSASQDYKNEYLSNPPAGAAKLRLGQVPQKLDTESLLAVF